VVNQKLLEAVFGEANVRAFVSAARDRLGALLDETFATDRRRFDEALGGLGQIVDAAALLRDAAARAADERPT
jgi:hypothetical protein